MSFYKRETTRRYGVNKGVIIEHEGEEEVSESIKK